MEDRFQTLRDSVCDTIGTIGNAAAGVVVDAGARVQGLLSAGRLNLRLAELESAEKTALCHVGQMIYATHTGHPTESEALVEKLREIDAIRLEIDRVKREIAAVKGLPVCGGCGSVGVSGDLYCRECGRKL